MAKINRHIKYEDALDELGIIEWRITKSCVNIDEFKNNFYKLVNGEYTQNEELFGFTYDDVESKYQEIKSAEPLRLLRIERNRLLSETDWTQNRDVTLTNDAEWAAYRQALRDLPNTATPSLDENGNLVGVEWPVKPGETA